MGKRPSHKQPTPSAIAKRTRSTKSSPIPPESTNSHSSSSTDVNIPPPSSSTLQLTPTQRLENFSKRPMLCCDIVELDPLIEVFPSFSTLKDVGCQSFFNCDQGVYPSLVCQFFANLVPTPGKTSLHSKVSGTDIFLSANHVERILHLTPSITKSPLSLPSDPRQELLKLYGRSPETKNYQYTALTSEARFLYYTVVRTILPRGTNKETLNEATAYFLLNVLNDRHPEIGDIVVTQLIKTASSVSGPLPYCNLLTKIFQAYDVPLPASERVSVNLSTIGIPLLKSLGYVLQDDDTWLHTDEIKAAKETSSAAAAKDVQENLEFQVYALKNEILSLHQEVQSLHKAIVSLQEAITTLKSSTSTMPTPIIHPTTDEALTPTPDDASIPPS